MKSKTIAAWLAFLGGPLGLHCFYLRGWGSTLGWLLPIPTALGLYGTERMRAHGIDDALSGLLIPLLGFTISGCALTAIVYGLMSAEKWNARYNASAPAHAEAGCSGWLTVGAVVLALFFGSTVLMASIAFSFQRFFEYQIEEGRKISQHHRQAVKTSHAPRCKEAIRTPERQPSRQWPPQRPLLES